MDRRVGSVRFIGSLELDEFRFWDKEIEPIKGDASCEVDFDWFCLGYGLLVVWKGLVETGSVKFEAEIVALSLTNLEAG